LDQALDDDPGLSKRVEDLSIKHSVLGSKCTKILIAPDVWVMAEPLVIFNR
jgi:hypothetical protein